MLSETIICTCGLDALLTSLQGAATPTQLSPDTVATISKIRSWVAGKGSTSLIGPPIVVDLRSGLSIQDVAKAVNEMDLVITSLDRARRL